MDKKLIKPSGYWTKDKVFEEARKYKTKIEFAKGCSGAYQVAGRKGWIDKMDWFVDGRVKLFTDKIDCVYKYYWEETNSIYIGRTIEREERHKKHTIQKNDTVFRYAKENGLEVPQMEIIEENLTVKEGLEREDYWVNYYKERGYNVLNIAKTGIGSGSLGGINFGKWTKERVFEKAKEYKTRLEFEKQCQYAYQKARVKGWLKEMPWLLNTRKTNNYWTKEKVFEKAKEYNSKTDFKKGCLYVFNIAYNNGWLKEMPWLKPKTPVRKDSKIILQIDMITNSVIREFARIKDAEISIGLKASNISACCYGRRNSAYGYKWSFK
jgi:recombinational DNA repair protein RecT